RGQTFIRLNQIWRVDDQNRRILARADALESILDPVGRSEKEHSNLVGRFLHGTYGPVDDHGRGIIAPHGIHRYPNGHCAFLVRMLQRGAVYSTSFGSMTGRPL